MDEAVGNLFGVGALVLGLVAWVGTFLIRRIVETAVPSARKRADANAPGITYLTPFSRWWNEVILYALPALVGGSCSGARVGDMVGPAVAQTHSGRIFFGIIVGFFSGFIYKVAAKLLKKSTGVDLEPERGGSIEPPPPSG
jgi:hypothetical protein